MAILFLIILIYNLYNSFSSFLIWIKEINVKYKDIYIKILNWKYINVIDEQENNMKKEIMNLFSFKLLFLEKINKKIKLIEKKIEEIK